MNKESLLYVSNKLFKRINNLKADKYLIDRIISLPLELIINIFSYLDSSIYDKHKIIILKYLYYLNDFRVNELARNIYLFRGIYNLEELIINKKLLKEELTNNNLVKDYNLDDLNYIIPPYNIIIFINVYNIDIFLDYINYFESRNFYEKPKQCKISIDSNCEVELNKEKLITICKSNVVTDLKLGRYINIKDIMFHSNLKHLSLYFTNYNINLLFPKKLKNLILNYNFNQIITPNLLPDSLENLDLGYNFNQKLLPNSLPHSILELSLSHDFNQIIDINVLPPKLEVLKVGYAFNQDLIPYSLPESLKVLSIYSLSNFNKEIKENVLPFNLRKIIFNDYYQQKINKNILPKNLNILKLPAKYDLDIDVNVLPDNLKELISFRLMHKSNILPKNLKKIIISDDFTNNKTLVKDCLPENLKELYFDYNVQIRLLPNILPHNINKIILPNNFNNILVKDTLPGNLKYLKFGNKYNKYIAPNILPNCLETLIFGNDFNQTIDINVLPYNLKAVIFGATFNNNYKTFNENILPPNLNLMIILNKKYNFNYTLQYFDITNLKLIKFEDKLFYNTLLYISNCKKYNDDSIFLYLKINLLNGLL